MENQELKAHVAERLFLQLPLSNLVEVARDYANHLATQNLKELTEEEQETLLAELKAQAESPPNEAPEEE